MVSIVVQVASNYLFSGNKQQLCISSNITIIINFYHRYSDKGKIYDVCEGSILKGPAGIRTQDLLFTRQAL